MNANILDLHADPNGPFHGPLAHAFACAVHISVNNGAPWNSPDRGCGCCDPREKREGLAESWGINSAADWRQQQEALLAGTSSNPTGSLLLELRRQASWQTGGAPVQPAMWYQAIAGWCQQNGRDNSVFQQLQGIVGMIVNYENRFVADGLLPPGAVVNDIRAWDLGRGANMARWGVHCGYTDPRTAHWYAARAGELARQYYGSWVEFSAAYILGRCLHFDNGEFGSRYTEPLDVHHTMVTHPQSPWLNIPFRV
ncbi:hypothetical protein F4561_004734 [Lipingzhangella halophila]|uniref:DUF1266 domain-containing protein n=1 Tax=Lipingzhangella halophila TaxID=1783352 RepID=A0A7W7W5J4_9ACTN|nr:DUF1266 domain-containing protein [Lipingzhangella halophila]MBB4933914.1 hypothetical protein [Lipingzhangella halophila]